MRNQTEGNHLNLDLHFRPFPAKSHNRDSAAANRAALRDFFHSIFLIAGKLISMHTRVTYVLRKSMGLQHADDESKRNRIQ
jgi:hypothetical protein